MSADEPSILMLHRRLIELRRKRAALRLGGYGEMSTDRDCLVFERTLGDERVAVALNFSGKSVKSGRLISMPWRLSGFATARSEEAAAANVRNGTPSRPSE